MLVPEWTPQLLDESPPLCWARLAQARAASRPGLCAIAPGRRAGSQRPHRNNEDYRNHVSQMLRVEPPSMGGRGRHRRGPPTSAPTVWLTTHCHRGHGTAPDVLALKPRPVGGPHHRHLGPRSSGCPVLWLLPPTTTKVLAQDERLGGRLGSEGV